MAGQVRVIPCTVGLSLSDKALLGHSGLSRVIAFTGAFLLAQKLVCCPGLIRHALVAKCAHARMELRAAFVGHDKTLALHTEALKRAPSFVFLASTKNTGYINRLSRA